MKLNYRETVLANSIRVASSLMPQVDSVAAGIWVGVGGRYESKELSGASHFIEHLLFKGTKTKSARQISEAIEGRGGYLNAFTQEESTCYYARIGAKHSYEMMSILADMYLHPRFAPDDINRERGVIIEEIMMYRDQPQHVVSEKLVQMLWDGHALGRPLTGTPENIKRMTREDILHFKDSKYKAKNTVIALAGKVDHDKCVKHLETLFGKVEPGPLPNFHPVKKQTAQEHLAVLQKDIEQTHLAMGFRLFGRHDNRRFILKLMSVILGENMSSRLFQIVREKNGLAYSISSGAHLFDDTGLFEISAGLDRKRSVKAFNLIINELLRLRETPVSPKALRQAKDYAIGQLSISLESTSNQMMWIGDNITNFDRVYQPDEVISKLEAVTAKQILELAQKILRKTNLSVAFVVPEKDGDTISADIKEQSARLSV